MVWVYHIDAHISFLIVCLLDFALILYLCAATQIQFTMN